MDGRTNRRLNKAAFLNLPSVVWTLPYTIHDLSNGKQHQMVPLSGKFFSPAVAIFESLKSHYYFMINLIYIEARASLTFP